MSRLPEGARVADNDVKIRFAVVDDLPAIRAIYNASVVADTASFDLEPVSLENRQDWFTAHGGDFPVLVAQSGIQVVGYASLSHYNPKPAYDIAAELSVYVAATHRRQGIGRKLSDAILERAKQGNLRTVVSLVTAENLASLDLHVQLGFAKVGTLHRCGSKFGRILDVVFYEKNVESAE
jgi:L-amino acid N-acyltransferase